MIFYVSLPSAIVDVVAGPTQKCRRMTNNDDRLTMLTVQRRIRHRGDNGMAAVGISLAERRLHIAIDHASSTNYYSLIVRTHDELFHLLRGRACRRRRSLITRMHSYRIYSSIVGGGPQRSTITPAT